jgi:hypothetical protein
VGSRSYLDLLPKVGNLNLETTWIWLSWGSLARAGLCSLALSEDPNRGLRTLVKDPPPAFFSSCLFLPPPQIHIPRDLFRDWSLRHQVLISINMSLLGWTSRNYRMMNSCLLTGGIWKGQVI